MEITPEKLKTYIEIAGAIMFLIIGIVFLIKILKTKTDKNGNGKIELEEITDADTEFVKNIIRESIITIATGMKNLNNLSGNNAYKMLLTEVKNSKNIFEEIEKGDKDNEKKI